MWAGLGVLAGGIVSKTYVGKNRDCFAGTSFDGGLAATGA
jgi:hypothetical protein